MKKTSFLAMLLVLGATNLFGAQRNPSRCNDESFEKDLKVVAKKVHDEAQFDGDRFSSYPEQICVSPYVYDFHRYIRTNDFRGNKDLAIPSEDNKTIYINIFPGDGIFKGHCLVYKYTYTLTHSP